MVTGALPQHEFKHYSWLNNIAVLEKPVSNSAVLSMVEKVLNKGKGILKKKVDPKELAAKIESPQPEVVSKDERRIEKAEERLYRAEERSDKTETRSNEAAARSDRFEARSRVAEILKKLRCAPRKSDIVACLRQRETAS
jgi:hypothetical protein